MPLHGHLIEQGLLAYAKSRGKRPLFYDPARSRGAKDSNPHHKKVAERLAEWVRSLGIEGVAPNHGWRHRFSTVSRFVGMPEDVRNIVQGHAGGQGRRRLRRDLAAGGAARDGEAAPLRALKGKAMPDIYTIFVARDCGADEIVARSVTAGQALPIAIGHGRAGHVGLLCCSDDARRRYEIVFCPPGSRAERVMALEIPRSCDEACDALIAAEALERLFLASPRSFWKGEVLSDEHFAQRGRHDREACAA